MKNSYKVFSFEDSNQWNNDFFNATKNGDKKKVMDLLGQAKKVYLDEYFIDSSITDLNLNNKKKEEKDKILESLKKCKLVKDVVEENNSISINTASVPIKISKLSTIIPTFHFSTSNSIINKSEHRAQSISQLLSFPNKIVTGNIYGIADKSKTVSTWVEFRNHKNQEFVIFPDTNTVYNKEGFYFLKHAEPFKKISSDDIKGKGSAKINEIAGSDFELEI